MLILFCGEIISYFSIEVSLLHRATIVSIIVDRWTIVSVWILRSTSSCKSR